MNDLMAGAIKPAPWAHSVAMKLVNFGGYAVMERPDLLRYDEMAFDRVARVIVVGERKHLAYLLDIQAVKDAMHADLRYQLATFAESIGLAYPLPNR